MAGSKKVKKQSNAVRNTIIVLICVALIGFIGYFVSTSGESPPSAEVPQNFISYPTVNSSIKSSTSGQQHSIDIDVVVEYDNGAQETVSEGDAYDKITEIVSSLDYDRLRQRDSIEHIEAELAKGLESVAGSGNISRVYVGNIAIDFPGVIESTKQTKSETNEKLKGLFKNLED